MTNAMIILGESIKLMEEGKLKGTGEFVAYEVNGEKKQVELPEPIHTFNGWKELGYRVKKGAKSNIKFAIWKHTSRAKREDELTGGESDELPVENMFMKTAAFFTLSQVEKA